MPDTPDVQVDPDVRKMSMAQMNKLSKQQLLAALKNVVSSPEPAALDDGHKVSVSSLKTMISEAILQVREDLLFEQRRLFESLEKRMNAEIEKISSKIQSFQQQVRDANEESFKIMDFEIEERLNRRSSVVFFGVKESDSADVQDRIRHDSEMLENLLKTLKIEDDVSKFRIRRIGMPSPGKTRLMHVKCEDIDTRNEVLRNRTQLKYMDEKVFVQPDMTKLQQRIAKNLRLELKQRRSRGENVIIRNHQIVPSRSS